MDAELLALADAAGTTIVTALATDVWEKARAAVGALWRRVRTDRAEGVQAEVADARTELLAARAAGDGRTEQDLVAEWQGRLRRLLAADPGVAGELRRLVGELVSALPAGQQAWAGDVHVTATASDQGRNHVVGQGTQNIVER